ncbi:MAG: hypothetical protein ACPGJV_07330 [Bacteriovoracaceae bacterium]
MMQVFKTIVTNSILREIRSKALFLFTFFSLILICLVNLGINLIFEHLVDPSLGSMIGNQSLFIVNGVLEFWSIFLAIILGTSSVNFDEETRILPLILTQPISRTTYLLARVLGTWIIVLGYYFVTLLFAGILFSITSNESILGMDLFLATLPNVLKCLGVIVLSMFFSNWLPRFANFVSMFILMFTLFLSSQAFFGAEIAERFNGDMTILKSIAVVLYMIFPRFSVLGKISSSFISEESLPAETIALQIGHFLLVTGGFLAIYRFYFSRKDVS